MPPDRRILADRRPTTDRPIVTHARIRIPALSRLAVGEQRSANDLYILRQSLSHSGEPGARTCTLTCAYGLNTVHVIAYIAIGIAVVGTLSL